MCLNTYCRNRNPGIQTAIYKYPVTFRKIKIVNKKHCIRIRRFCSIKNFLYQLHAPQVLAYPGDSIVITVVYGHDDHFVYYIPYIDNTFKIRNISVYTVKLLAKYSLVIIFHKPVCTLGMPAKRMSLGYGTMLTHQLCSLHQQFGSGLSFFLLKLSPIKRKRSIVKQIKPFFRSVHKHFFSVCCRQKIKCTASEKKFMPRLLNLYIGICKRLSGCILKLNIYCRSAVCILCFVH